MIEKKPTALYVMYSHKKLQRITIAEYKQKFTVYSQKKKYQSMQNLEKKLVHLA